MKIEDILLQKGAESKKKLDKLENELYGNLNTPQITKMAKSLQRESDVHNRLYDLQKKKDDTKSSSQIPKKKSASLNTSHSGVFSKSTVPSFDIKLHSQ
jgi:hypothetical protein